MVFWTGHRISNFFSNHTRGRFYHAAQRRGKLRDCTGECGGKRSATPLWFVFVPYPSQDEPLKPKRRRASLAAALHNGNSPAVAISVPARFFCQKFFITFGSERLILASVT